MRLFLLLSVLLLPLAPLAAQQGVPPDPRSPEVAAGDRLNALVERVRYEHARMKTLEASFTQSKESALLLEPSEARGTFSFAAPDRVRWEYETPNPISLLVRGEEMTTWYRDLGQAERIFIGQQTQKILDYLGASSSLATLLQYFEARLAHSPSESARPFRLELTPRYERVARRLSEMTLWIDSGLFLPTRLRYVEPDGDVTEYRFENLKINQGIPESTFDLDLPQDVEVKEVDLDRRLAAR